MAKEVKHVLAPDPEKSDRLLVVVMMKLKSMSLTDLAISNILQQEGLPKGAEEDFQFRLSFSQEMRILLEGLRIAARGKSLMSALFAALPGVGVDNFGTVGLAMKHAPNFMEVVKLIYGDLVFTWAHTRLLIRQTNNRLVLGFLERPGTDQLQQQKLYPICTAFDMVTLLRVLQDIGGSAFYPDVVRFPFPAPENHDLFTQQFPIQVEYVAANAEMVFSPATAFAQPGKADPYLYRLFRAQTDQSYTSRTPESDADRVMQLLSSRTPPPARSEIAARMGMTERNLSRRLSNAGTSYRRLWIKVQHQQATRLLQDTQYSVADIGYILGYSDPAAFTRAFSGWAGCSPAKFRSNDNLW